MCAVIVTFAGLSLTGCGQLRPEGDNSTQTPVSETAVSVPAVTEAPIVIETEAPVTEAPVQPATEAQTQPVTEAQTQPAPQTEVQTSAPVSLSEDEELSQYYQFAEAEIGTRFANADVNVRTGPTTDADNIVSSLDKGEEITVIGETANWYQIYKAKDTVTGLSDLSGYVMKNYLSGTYDEAMAVQPSETAAPAQTAEAAPAAQEAAPAAQEAVPAAEEAPQTVAASASGPQVTVISDANIRSDQYETASVVGVVNAGTTVTQIGSGDGWVQIDYNGVQGYIKASMIG